MSDDLTPTNGNGNGNGNGKATERRDYILGLLFIVCLLAMGVMSWWTLTTPQEWAKVQFVQSVVGDFKTFALMILTGHFALSQLKK